MSAQQFLIKKIVWSKKLQPSQQGCQISVFYQFWSIALIIADFFINIENCIIEISKNQVKYFNSISLKSLKSNEKCKSLFLIPLSNAETYWILINVYKCVVVKIKVKNANFYYWLIFNYKLLRYKYF